MNDTQQQQPPTDWDQALATMARAYEYPPTPDIVAAIRRPTGRRPAAAASTVPQRRAPSWAAALAAIVLLFALGILAVPQTRAAVLSLVARIGAISIFLDETLPVATPLPATLPSAVAPSTPVSLAPTPVALALLAAVPGRPIPVDALEQFESLPVRLPPADGEWGVPDSAVLHQLGTRPLVTLIWDDPDRPGYPILTLSQTDIPQLAFKMAAAEQVTPVAIGDSEGMWIAGPHTLQLPINGGPPEAWITGNVLVWSDGIMTYRIEGDITQAAAVRLANSIMDTAAP
jgi:hypothetical protein